MYYPKSQITPNLYTNGGEYKVLKTDKVYMGYYYSLSNGNSFVGKSPTSEKTQQLLVPIKKQKKTPTSPLLPKVIKPNPLLSKQGYSNKINERYIPKPSSTPPTPIDYNRGVISRFFCKKIMKTYILKLIKKHLLT